MSLPFTEHDHCPHCYRHKTAWHLEGCPLHPLSQQHRQELWDGAKVRSDHKTDAVGGDREEFAFDVLESRLYRITQVCVECAGTSVPRLCHSCGHPQSMHEDDLGVCDYFALCSCDEFVQRTVCLSGCREGRVIPQNIFAIAQEAMQMSEWEDLESGKLMVQDALHAIDKRLAEMVEVHD